MKKIISAILVMLLVLAAIPAFAEPVSEVMQVVNCTSWVSLREKNDTTSMRLEKVYLGEFVTNCSSASNGFVKCTFEGKTGYILSKYLKTTEYTGWDKLLRNQEVVNCEEWVSLRRLADAGSERLEKVPKGAVVTGCVDANGFIKCTYKGKTGYIMSKYLNTATYNPTPDPVISTSAIMQVTNCTSWVTLRKTASTSAARVEKVHLGELVKVTGTSGNFVKCTYNGKTGYILSSYLKKTNISSNAKILPNQMTTTVYGGNVSFRAAASTSSARLDSIPTGAIVTGCVQEGSSWVRCTYKGMTGYVYAKYLKNAY